MNQRLIETKVVANFVRTFIYTSLHFNLKFLMEEVWKKNLVDLSERNLSVYNNLTEKMR